MAVKISELPTITGDNINGGVDIVPIVDVSESKTVSTTMRNFYIGMVEATSKAAPILRRGSPTARGIKNHTDVSKVYAAIQAGTFDNLDAGDSIIVNNHTYVVADYSTFYRDGYSEQTRLQVLKHIVLLGKFFSGIIDSDNTNSNGIVGTSFYQNTLPEIEAIIEADFPGMALVMPMALSTKVTDGVVTNREFKARKARLLRALDILGYPLEESAPNVGHQLGTAFRCFSNFPPHTFAYANNMRLADVASDGKFYTISNKKTVVTLNNSIETVLPFVFCLGDTTNQLPEVL